MLSKVVACPCRSKAHVLDLKGSSLQATTTAIPAFPQAVDYTITNKVPTKPYAGIDYLALGYDLFRGNPNGENDSQRDPGLRLPLAVVDATDPNLLTADTRNTIPKGGYGMPLSSCSLASTVRSERTADEHTNSMQLDVKVEAEFKAGYKGAYSVEASGKFKASNDYMKLKNTVEDKAKERFSMVSYCLFYELGFFPKSLLTPNPAFKAACDALKAIKGKDAAAVQEAWFQFFATWGTHYLRKVRLGGKMTHTLEIEDSKRNTHSKEQVKTKQAAEFAFEASGFGYSGSAGIKTNKNTNRDTEIKAALEQMSVTETRTVNGGLPVAVTKGNATESFAAWAPTVLDHPMPIQYDLVRLPDGWDVPDLINKAEYEKYMDLYADHVYKLAEGAWLRLPINAERCGIKHRNKYLSAFTVDNGRLYRTRNAAMQACHSLPECVGVTEAVDGSFTTRSGHLQDAVTDDVTWLKAECPELKGPYQDERADGRCGPQYNRAKCGTDRCCSSVGKCGPIATFSQGGACKDSLGPVCNKQTVPFDFTDGAQWKDLQASTSVSCPHSQHSTNSNHDGQRKIWAQGKYVRVDGPTHAKFRLDMHCCKTDSPCEPYMLHVGPSPGDTKTVRTNREIACPTFCGAGCRANRDSNASDTFSVTTQDNGDVTVKRTDQAAGWAMDLAIPCCNVSNTSMGGYIQPSDAKSERIATTPFEKAGSGRCTNPYWGGFNKLCEQKCANDGECNYFTTYNTGWCSLFTTCDAVQPVNFHGQTYRKKGTGKTPYVLEHPKQLCTDKPISSTLVHPAGQETAADKCAEKCDNTQDCAAFATFDGNHWCNTLKGCTSTYPSNGKGFASVYVNPSGFSLKYPLQKCSDENLLGSGAVGAASCAAKCESDPRCKAFSKFDNGWCNWYSSCEKRTPSPQQPLINSYER